MLLLEVARTVFNGRRIIASKVAAVVQIDCEFCRALVARTSGSLLSEQATSNLTGASKRTLNVPDFAVTTGKRSGRVKGAVPS
jgi:hypothetical protein